MTIERKITVEPWNPTYRPVTQDSRTIAYEPVEESLPAPSPPAGEGWTLAAMAFHTARLPLVADQEFVYYTWERVKADVFFTPDPVNDWANRKRLDLARGKPMPTLREWLAVGHGLIVGTFVSERFAVVRRYVLPKDKFADVTLVVPHGYCASGGIEELAYLRASDGAWTSISASVRELPNDCLDAQAIAMHEIPLTLKELKEMYP